MAAVIGGSIGLSLAADAKTDSTGHWFALFGGAVVGVWVPPMSSGLVKLLNELGRVAIHTVRVRSLGVGTALTVGGIGLFVAKLPETVAYAVRYIPMTPSEYPWENDYALPTALHRDEMLIGLAAMLIASGLFLRTLPKADDF